MKKKSTLSKGLSWAFFLNLLFAVIELIGGYLTNSTAIITDAFHDFMDAAAIGVAVYMDKYSKKEASENYHFGYRRFSLLSALLLSVILLVGASFMLYHAITSFAVNKEINSLGMLGLAALGIVINGFAFLRIRNEGAAHNHSHSHAHPHSHAPKDANNKAVMLHLLEDVLGWIAVLVGAFVMYFTKWYWIDSLLTLLIALFIAYNALGNLWNSFKILLQKAPEYINLHQLKQNISEITDIESIVSIKIWSIDGIQNVASVHIIISDIQYYQLIQNQIKELLQKKYHINETTIEIK